MHLSTRIAFIAAISFCLNTSIATCEEPTRAILKNGLVVLVQEEHSAPLVAIEAQVKTGSASEYGYLGSGISHFIEHMLFKGAGAWPAPGDIENQIKSLGGYLNAYTNFDATGVHLIVPSEHAEKALEVLRDMLTGAKFDSGELEKEREVILKEIRLDNDDPNRFSSRLLWSTMLKTHNYRFPVIGYEEIFNELKREDLLNYYRSNYVPDNVVLGVAGDIRQEKILKTIEKLFVPIERRPVPMRLFQKEPPQIAAMRMRAEKEVSLTYLTLGFRSVSVRNKDMFSVDVLAMILGTGGSSRLSRKLYMQEQLVSSIGSYSYTPKDPGVFVIKAVLKDEDVDRALKEIWCEIESLKKNLISEAELAKAKNIVMSDYIFARQTLQDRVSDLVNGETITGDYDFSKKYVAGINAVTKEDVREVARKYLTNENSTTILLAPKWPQSKEPEAPKPPLYKIGRLEFDNGLRAIIFEDHRLPIVTMSIVGMGGTRSEKSADNGIANLTAGTLLCGTASKTEEQIFSQIEGEGASLNSFISANNFTVSAGGLSKDQGLLLDTCADLIKNPRFPEDKLEREKRVATEQIKRLNDDIYALGVRTLKYALFKTHPYRFSALGRPAVISTLSRKDILDYYSLYYAPGNMVLSVSGDVDPKLLRVKIAALFGKLAKRPPLRINPPCEKKSPRPRILTRTAAKEQSVIMRGYLGARVYEHDRYVLEVLASALSGINGRLAKNIREEKGLAYSLNALSMPGLERGMFLFYVGTSAENLQTAQAELFKEIAAVKKEGISDEELQSAKNQLIGAYKVWLQRTQDVAAKAAADEVCGADYLNYQKFEGRVRHITKECVARAARKYLDDYSYVLLTIKGEIGEDKGI